MTTDERARFAKALDGALCCIGEHSLCVECPYNDRVGVDCMHLLRLDLRRVRIEREVEESHE